MRELTHRDVSALYDLRVAQVDLETRERLKALSEKREESVLEVLCAAVEEYERFDRSIPPRGFVDTGF